MADLLSWGSKVSPAFRGKVRSISSSLALSANDLMDCMAWESAQTFRADIRNAAGSGAVGLIQFMPSTAAALGTSATELAAMPAEAQLDYVQAYFAPRRGKLANLGDLYMAILWPEGIGKPDSYVLFDKADPHRPKLYIQNAGLDYNKDGKITRGEAMARVAALSPKGRALAA